MALSALLSLGGFAAPASAVSAAEAEYSESGAVRLVFTDGGITASGGEGYKIEGTALTVQEAGTYILSGSCADGSVKVKKGVTDVTLVLDGLTLTSASTAPITCNKSSGVKIVAAADTVNTLTDAAKNNDDSYPDNTDAENAVIKAKDGSNLILCGTGTLNVQANGKNGIKSGAATDEEGEASLVIRDLTLNITATVNDAINAEASLTVASGTLTISAADDAIHSDYLLNIGASGTAGPTVTVTTCYEGLEAATLNVYSGNIRITATDDCMNAANSDLSGYAFSLNIAGGTLWMYTTAGDGIDSNGTLTVSGGTLEVWTSNMADNQPLDADGEISITGGTVFAAGGSAGMGMNLNASQPYVTFGSGFAMGGMGGMGGRPGGWGGRQNNFGSTPPEMPGGQNDFGSTPPEMPGGQNMPNMQSGSGSSVSIAKGSAVSVRDSAGDELYTTEAPCSASYVIFSSAAMTDGESYSLTAGSQTAASAEAQSGQSSGGFGPGSFTPGANGFGPGSFTPAGPSDTAASGNESDTADTAAPADTADTAAPADTAASSSGVTGETDRALWIPLALIGAAALCAGAFFLGKKSAK